MPRIRELANGAEDFSPKAHPGNVYDRALLIDRQLSLATSFVPVLYAIEELDYYYKAPLSPIVKQALQWHYLNQIGYEPYQIAATTSYGETYIRAGIAEIEEASPDSDIFEARHRLNRILFMPDEDQEEAMSQMYQDAAVLMVSGQSRAEIEQSLQSRFPGFTWPAFELAVSHFLIKAISMPDKLDSMIALEMLQTPEERKASLLALRGVNREEMQRLGEEARGQDIDLTVQIQIMDALGLFAETIKKALEVRGLNYLQFAGNILFKNLMKERILKLRRQIKNRNELAERLGLNPKTLNGIINRLIAADEATSQTPREPTDSQTQRLLSDLKILVDQGLTIDEIKRQLNAQGYPDWLLFSNEEFTGRIKEYIIALRSQGVKRNDIIGQLAISRSRLNKLIGELAVGGQIAYRRYVPLKRPKIEELDQNIGALQLEGLTVNEMIIRLKQQGYVIQDLLLSPNFFALFKDWLRQVRSEGMTVGGISDIIGIDVNRLNEIISRMLKEGELVTKRKRYVRLTAEERLQLEAEIESKLLAGERDRATIARSLQTTPARVEVVIQRLIADGRLSSLKNAPKAETVRLKTSLQECSPSDTDRLAELMPLVTERFFFDNRRMFLTLGDLLKQLRYNKFKAIDTAASILNEPRNRQPLGKFGKTYSTEEGTVERRTYFIPIQCRAGAILLLQGNPRLEGYLIKRGAK